MTDLSGENNDDNNVIDKKEKHSFNYKVFVHVFDQCTQDSDTIVAIRDRKKYKNRNSDSIRFDSLHIRLDSIRLTF